MCTAGRLPCKVSEKSVVYEYFITTKKYIVYIACTKKSKVLIIYKITHLKKNYIESRIQCTNTQHDTLFSKETMIMILAELLGSALDIW